MFCSKCGTKVEEGAKFCLNCGAPIEQTVPVQAATVQAASVQPQPATQEPVVEPAQPQPEPTPVQPQPVIEPQPVPVVPAQPQPAPVPKTEPVVKPVKEVKAPKKKNSNVALFGILGLGIIVAVVALVLRFTIGSRSSATCFTEARVMLDSIDFEDGEKITLLTGSGDAVVFEISDLEGGDYNLDCSKLALVDEDQVLYYADKNGLVEIADNVVTARISDDGTGIAYIVSDTKEDQECLYLYDREKKTKSLIAEHASSQGFCISPDGQSVAYIAEYVSSSDFELYLSVDGESEKVGNTKTPIAVADNGKYLYYVDEGRLYVKNGEDSQKLSSDFEYEYILNKDYSEIVFNDEYQCYISQKAGEKEQFLTDEYTQIFLPSNVAFKQDLFLGGITCGTSTLTGYLYHVNETVVYVDKKLNNTELFDGYVSYSVVSEKNDSMLFTNDGDLYLLSDFSGKTEPKMLGEDLGIRTFVTNKDNSYVYYLNEDDELMYQKGSSDAKKIADDVEYQNCMYDQYDEILYFIADADASQAGQIYYSKSGSKKQKVKNMEDMSIVSEVGRVYAVTNRDTDDNICYVLKNAKAYELLKEISE